MSGSQTGGAVFAVIVVLAALIGLGIVAASCSKVEPGYAGIIVSNYGSERGVQDYPIKTGRVWHNPLTQDVYKFPTRLQTIVWTMDETEGSPNNESITFNSIEGAIVNADISLSYSFQYDKVPSLFVEFRETPENIRDVYMRSQVRDAFGRVASTVEVMKIFGVDKQTVLDDVKKALQDVLGPKGITIDMVSFVGALRVSERVENAINAVIEANQRAAEARERVLQVKAEAQQRVARADGEALAIREVADATAYANDTVGESLRRNTDLLQWEAVKKWNGVLPQVSVGDGGTVPFIQLPVPGLEQSGPPSGYVGAEKP